MNRNGLGIFMVGVVGLVVVHGTATERYCAAHPDTQTCDNPIAPGPDFPHEGPQVPASGSSAPGPFFFATSSSTTPIGTTVLSNGFRVV